MNKGERLSHKHIHLDLVGGIAGDMFIAAVLDSFEFLKPIVLGAASNVIPKSIGCAQVSSGMNAGISGLTFGLILSAESAYVHTAEHDQHSHTTYKNICALIAESELEGDVKTIAIELLTIIGRAEAKIHAKALDEVHFHELADWDSVLDVVSVAVILNELKTASWSISSLPLGGGLVKTAHGWLPVPAPATAEMLTGFEFVNDGVQGERITPTGACILRYLKDKQRLTGQASGSMVSTGFGLGSRQLPNMPNILRALVFSAPSQKDAMHTQLETVYTIEFDIDDMTGEEIAIAADKLRATAGVLDVCCASVRGKKNRPVEVFRIMVKPECLPSVADRCFIETSTIGLRYHLELRQNLARKHGEISGQKVKWVTRPGGGETVKIESDELANIESLQARRLLKLKTEQGE